jgi:hypothetical protein
MVFLCDLFAAHDETARQDLYAFDAVGENASYYSAMPPGTSFIRPAPSKELLCFSRRYLRAAQGGNLPRQPAATLVPPAAGRQLLISA